MCLLICSTEYTASFVPRRQETISKSNCLSAACLNAAGTALLAFPSIRPGVIPSHLIPLDLELARTWTLVNPQLPWLFGPFVINHIFLSFVSESGSTYCSCRERAEGRSAWPTCILVVCRYQSPFPWLIQSSKSMGAGVQLCKNKSWCWFNPITLRWSLNHWTLSRIPALIL